MFGTNLSVNKKKKIAPPFWNPGSATVFVNVLKKNADAELAFLKSYYLLGTINSPIYANEHTFDPIQLLVQLKITSLQPFTIFMDGTSRYL